MFGDNIKSGLFRREDDTFTFFNPDVFPRQYGILGSRWTTTAFPELIPIDSTIIQNPNEFLDYQQLINDKEINPKSIRGMRILVSKSQNLLNPLGWQRRNPDGTMYGFVDFPTNLIPLDQFQTGVVDIYYDKMTVGLNEFFRYTIGGLQSITMTFIYDEFRLETLLDKNIRKVVYKEMNGAQFDKLL